MAQSSSCAERCRTLRLEPLEQRQLLSVNVTTARYDNARDGANTSETVLTPSNVNTTQFGKIATMTTDAQIYTQPLVMTNVAVPGYGTRNVVYVATENDTVYAFDAQGNNPAQGYLWKTSLLNLDSGTTGETAVPETDYGTTDITPIIGVTGTPVIDPTTNTMYVVGLFKETNATYEQRIYALNITDGAVKPGTRRKSFRRRSPAPGRAAPGGRLPSTRFAKTSGRRSRWPMAKCTSPGPATGTKILGTAG